MLEDLLKEIESVLLSENNEGCSEDLTVVSSQAIQSLRATYERERLKK